MRGHGNAAERCLSGLSSSAFASIASIASATAAASAASVSAATASALAASAARPSAAVGSFGTGTTGRLGMCRSLHAVKHIGFGPGLHVDLLSVQVRTVHLGDGRLRFVGNRHGHHRLRFAGRLVGDDIDRADLAEGAKNVSQLVLVYLT